MTAEISYSDILDRSAQKAEVEIKINREMKKVKSEMYEFVVQYVDKCLNSKHFTILTLIRFNW